MMATRLAIWDEPENAESSLFHARLHMVLGTKAEVARVAIHPETGTVDIAIRLPEDLTDSQRDLRTAWVSAKALDLAYELFAEDDLVLNRIRMLQPGQPPPQDSPIRPRRGGDRP